MFNKLLECPYCGKKATLFIFLGNGFYVFKRGKTCQKCSQKIEFNKNALLCYYVILPFFCFAGIILYGKYLANICMQITLFSNWFDGKICGILGIIVFFLLGYLFLYIIVNFLRLRLFVTQRLTPDKDDS